MDLIIETLIHFNLEYNGDYQCVAAAAVYQIVSWFHKKIIVNWDIIYDFSANSTPLYSCKSYIDFQKKCLEEKIALYV